VLLHTFISSPYSTSAQRQVRNSINRPPGPGSYRRNAPTQRVTDSEVEVWTTWIVEISHAFKNPNNTKPEDFDEDFFEGAGFVPEWNFEETVKP